MPKIKIKKIHPNAIIPKYAHEGDAGMDLSSVGNIVIKPGEIVLVPTGLKLELPFGYELQIRPRSGLALNKGITLPNSPGTIDYGYRGELKVILINHGKENFHIKPRDKIAQAVLNKTETAEIEEVNELNNTSRGEGGFGSTDLK